LHGDHGIFYSRYPQSRQYENIPVITGIIPEFSGIKDPEKLRAHISLVKKEIFHAPNAAPRDAIVRVKSGTCLRSEFNLNPAVMRGLSKKRK
jgi:hypothetical protein